MVVSTSLVWSILLINWAFIKVGGWTTARCTQNNKRTPGISDKGSFDLIAKMKHSLSTRLYNSNQQKSASTIAENKKGGYEYEWEEKIEAGIQLVGTEVKSCRRGNVQLSDGFAQVLDGECFLCNVHIAEYFGSGPIYQHTPKRNRKLLLHKKEILKLEQRMVQQNFEIIPVSMYFTPHQRVKVELGIGKKKNMRDKRQEIMGKEGNREIRRVMKNISFD
mmetsp:Transcript_28747/g.48227  ORF Transcript_28747/g.48227 Transcript_28747/m.48227 type:complete len:220 (+) Transcript_28747:150-809(+)